MTIELSNGMKMPLIGLGTQDGPGGVVGQAVRTALQLGYKLIDCARYYKNEKEIGEMGLKPYLQNRDRNELFITSKLWFDQTDRVMESCKESIEAL